MRMRCRIFMLERLVLIAWPMWSPCANTTQTTSRVLWMSASILLAAADLYASPAVASSTSQAVLNATVGQFTNEVEKETSKSASGTVDVFPLLRWLNKPHHDS